MHARTLPARHGILWLLAGFALFRRNPPLLTVLTFAYLLLVVLINLVPLIGPFMLPLALPEVAPGLLPIVEMLPIQYFVIPLALARGFEPAAFLNAQKITTGE